MADGMPAGVCHTRRTGLGHGEPVTARRLSRDICQIDQKAHKTHSWYNALSNASVCKYHEKQENMTSPPIRGQQS